MTYSSHGISSSYANVFIALLSLEHKFDIKFMQYVWFLSNYCESLLLMFLVTVSYHVFFPKGVKKGDRVAIYLPMIPELVYSMLACARIGAVHSIVVGASFGIS